MRSAGHDRFHPPPVAVVAVSVVVAAALWFGGHRLVDRRLAASDAQFGALDIELIVDPRAAVDVTTDQILGDLDDELRHSSVAGTDGLLTATLADVRLSKPGSPTIDACLAEINLASARRFGPHPALGGGRDAPSRVRSGEVVLTQRGAERLNAHTGDILEVAASSGASDELRVAAVAPSVGALSLCEGVVGDGGLTALGAERGRHLDGRVLLSADGAERTDEATSIAVDALTAKFASRSWVAIGTPKIDRRRVIESTRAVWTPVAVAVAVAGVVLGGALHVGSRRERSGQEAQEL